MGERLVRPELLPEQPVSRPAGPASGQIRVLRGGSWYVDPRDVRVSYRNRFGPANRLGNNVGFRCAVHSLSSGPVFIARELPGFAFSLLRDILVIQILLELLLSPRCSQMVTRQPAGLPPQGVRSICQVRSRHHTVLFAATGCLCCREKVQSKSCPRTGTKAFAGCAADGLNFRFISPILCWRRNRLAYSRVPIPARRTFLLTI